MRLTLAGRGFQTSISLITQRHVVEQSGGVGRERGARYSLVGNPIPADKDSEGGAHRVTGKYSLQRRPSGRHPKVVGHFGRQPRRSPGQVRRLQDLPSGTAVLLSSSDAETRDHAVPGDFLHHAGRRPAWHVDWALCSVRQSRRGFEARAHEPGGPVLYVGPEADSGVCARHELLGRHPRNELARRG
jgi:hypothetical protein